MRVAALAAGKNSPSASDLAAIDLDKITDDSIRESLAAVNATYEALGGGDRVAKGPELVEKVKAELAATIG
jgi:hypothetical protein